MSNLVNDIREIISSQSNSPTIVFPEGNNAFVEEAALKIKEESKINPLLVVSQDSEIKENGLNYISMSSYSKLNEMTELLFELRKEKGLTLEAAKELLTHSNYFATMLIKMEEADGYVGGIEYTTADTLRPALQIIKTDKNSKIVSSVFVMEKEEQRFLFADCAINLDPTAEQVAQIARQVNEFGLTTANMKEVRTALLSYSTAGSGKGPDASKMEEAYELLKGMDMQGQKFFGSMQFDSAFVKSVMDKKAPELQWSETANSFIFPNLSSGNIGYKIAQRLGDFSAIGPVLLGLAAPVNDLSRGASVQDIIDVTYITALQALKRKG